MSKVYTIGAPVRGEIWTPAGAIVFAFDAGEHTPADAGELEALEHLRRTGAVQLVEKTRRARAAEREG